MWSEVKWSGLPYLQCITSQISLKRVFSLKNVLFCSHSEWYSFVSPAHIEYTMKHSLCNCFIDLQYAESVQLKLHFINAFFAILG